MPLPLIINEMWHSKNLLLPDMGKTNLPAVISTVEPNTFFYSQQEIIEFDDITIYFNYITISVFYFVFSPLNICVHHTL